MKRINNLYEQIHSIANLEKADQLASLGKSKTYGVIWYRAKADLNLLALQNSLINNTYQTSQYDVFNIHEPKERTVYRLPYFPDRIAHHAIMAVLEPIFVKVFTVDTYSCIKGRGIHGAFRNLRKALKDVPNTAYCLKLDITKFYPSVDHNILKILLRKKFKDTQLLDLLYEIIDSAPGLPIGNYISQYLANFYLTYFDHWLKEDRAIKYYFRYADDLVILHSDKDYLHKLRVDITEYLLTNLKLQVKGNYQVFPVAKRGIDFIGYVFYHTHIFMRKSIKKKLCKAVRHNKPAGSIASYKGWAIHCNSKNLLRKLDGKAS